jgi:hypothetical protein|nr:MAG TPA: Head-to-tail joining protein W (GpW), fast protein folding, downhill [Caudoviricetes sp.]
MTDSERVVAIRQALKEHGYNNRKVGVRYDGYAIWLTIKDLAIDIKEIEQLAKGYESYERDEFTGEILSGGNTFVFVNYAYGLTA